MADDQPTTVVDIKVTVIGTRQPIVHPPTAEAVRALARAARAVDPFPPNQKESP